MNTEAASNSIEQLWAAATESNSDYYVRQFSNISEKGGVGVTWHWPAFLFGSLWFLYRRMYLWAVLALVFTGVVSSLVFETVGESAPVELATTLAVMVLMGVAANSLYLRHVSQRIARLAADHPQVADQVESLRSGRATNTGLVLGVVIVLFVLGVVAAIAVPAYRDYTVRSQVVEGFGLVSSARDSMEKFRATNGRWPRDAAELGVDWFSGQYVTSVDISGPSLVATYGGAANPLVAGKRVEFRAYEDAAGKISWRCGFAIDKSEPLRRTTVMPQFLPRECRP